jgi:hypothetical protein
MIGVNVIFSAKNSKWHAECLASLSGQACTLLQQDNADDAKSIVESRMAAFDASGADLLSWVDDDDTVSTGIFALCEKVLQDNPHAGGCFTLEDWIFEGGRPSCPGMRGAAPDTILRTPQAAHHVVVVRRRVYDALRPLIAQQEDGIDWMLAIGAFKLGGLIQIPVVGYQWRRHKGSATASGKTYSRSLGDETAHYLNGLK